MINFYAGDSLAVQCRMIAVLVHAKTILRASLPAWPVFAGIAVGLLVSGVTTASEHPVPPLDEVHRTELESARDNRDYRETAFIALIEHVRTWQMTDPGTEPVRQTPDVDRLLADPDAHRGDLHWITGTIAQVEFVPEPYGPAVQWFVRVDDETPRGTPVIVYVAEGDDNRITLDEGDRVTVLTRFYKRMTFEARDGDLRSYPAFVGALPQRALRYGWSDAGDKWGQIAVFAIPVIALLVVLILLLAYIRRRAPGRLPRGRRRSEVDSRAVDDDVSTLPDEPADALAELRRRAKLKK